MTAEKLIQYLSWAFYLLVFVVTVVRAMRQRRRANIDIALFFSISALIIAIGTIAEIGLLSVGPLPNAINTFLVLSLGYALLRLVDDFTPVPNWLMRGAAALLALFAACAFVLPPPRPALLNLAMTIYLVGLLCYATVTFFRAASSARGVTRRRLRAVAAGSLILTTFFLFASIGSLLGLGPQAVIAVSDLLGLASGVSFYLGFAPPLLLRRAWQEPELRAFLGHAASLPRLPDTDAIMRELERGAVTSVGASGAVIGVWHEDDRVISFPHGDPTYRLDPAEPIPVAQAFREQRPVFADNVLRDNPDYAEVSLRYDVKAVLAAPITAGPKRLGVLVVHAPRAPIFADDDLALVQLLADQAAVILESRALIDEAARVRALEEAARLKDDFLSAAAHDLKTPLTTLVGRAQLMERRALRDPAGPADLSSIQLLVSEGQRLKRLVQELLDAARAERGRLVGPRTPTDLVQLAREACERYSSDRHTCEVDADETVVGEYDTIRIAQLLENLLENAVKYSPDGGAIRVALRRLESGTFLSVSDSGIGIPADDLPHVFERFYRASNVDDRRFAGMGLGLFICRGIVEQHGGRIEVTSRPGQGTTFQITLPLAPVGAEIYA